MLPCLSFAGADLNIMDFDKRAPIHLALEEGKCAVYRHRCMRAFIKLLLDWCSCCIWSVRELEILHPHPFTGEEPIVEMLLEKGADPNLPSQDFVSCLHFLATR